MVLWVNSFFVNFFSKSKFIILLFSQFIFKNSSILIFLQNNLDYTQSKLSTSSNTALFNSMAIYHPAALSTFFIITLYAYKRKYCILKHKKQKKYKDFSFIIVLIAFSLGSYWSAQELLWNGFWNWDFVELTLFLLLLITGLFAHTLSKRIRIVLVWSAKKLFLFLLLIYVFVNRTSLIISQHSFSASFLYSLNLYYIQLVFLLSVIVMILTLYKQVTFNRIINYALTTIFIFVSLFFFFVFIKIYLLDSGILNKDVFRQISIFYVNLISIWYVKSIYLLNIKLQPYIILLVYFYYGLRFRHSWYNVIHSTLTTVFLVIMCFAVSTTIIQNYTTANLKLLYFTGNRLAKVDACDHLLVVFWYKKIYKTVIYFFVSLMSGTILFNSEVWNYYDHNLYFLNFGFFNICVFWTLSKLTLRLKTNS